MDLAYLYWIQFYPRKVISALAPETAQDFISAFYLSPMYTYLKTHLPGRKEAQEMFSRNVQRGRRRRAYRLTGESAV